MNKSLKALILGSLLLNVLLVGGIGGYLLKRSMEPAFPPPPPHHHAMQPPTGTRAMPAFEALPPAMRHSLQQQLDVLFQNHRVQWQEAKALRKGMRDILSAEDFDAEAYLEEMARMHDLRGTMMQDFAEKVASLADTLSLEERRALAELLRNPPHWRWKCESLKQDNTEGEIPTPHP